MMPHAVMMVGNAHIRAYFCIKSVAFVSLALLAYHVRNTEDIYSTAIILSTTMLQVNGLVNNDQQSSTGFRSVMETNPLADMVKTMESDAGRTSPVRPYMRAYPL